MRKPFGDVLISFCQPVPTSIMHTGYALQKGMRMTSWAPTSTDKLHIQAGPPSPPYGVPYGSTSANASPTRGLGLTPHPAKIGHVRFNVPYGDNVVFGEAQNRWAYSQYRKQICGVLRSDASDARAHVISQVGVAFI